MPEDFDNDAYTAVIFFHGMGSQRRYESVSQLVDSLDAYTNFTGGGYLKPRDADVAFENVTNVSQRMAYLKTEYKVHISESSFRRRARFYEVYWAPIAAQAPTLYETLVWLFKQVLAPFRTITTPWRDRERLHRAVLLRMWGEAKRSQAFSESHFVTLSRLYEDFVRRASNPRASTFADFRTFVRRAKPKDLKKIEDLCVRWFWHYRWDQLKALATVTTVLLYLAFVLLLLVGAVYAASKVLPIPFLDNLISAVNLEASINFLYARLPTWLQDIFRQPWAKWASMLLALASFSVTRFLRHYLGDVLQWVTYEETDVKNQKRREILNLGFNTLLYLLSSKQCDRLVVVGHSLGSAIAMDSLLELRRHALTQSHQGGTQPLPFEKFTDFITLGSPIDRIHYFFESYRVKKSKRYGSVVEKVRGDLGTEPFTGHTPVRWVNVHDRSDVISSALHTPNATSKNKILAVENVKTGSYLFPLLPVAHSSYFQSRVALKFIFEAVFGDRPVHGGRPLTCWESGAQDLDPGRTRRRTTFMAVAILLALASLRLLFDAKPKDEEKPLSSSLEAHPTSDVQNVGKWTTGLSQVMAYIGVAWIWILAFLLTFILFAVQPLITPFLVLLLVATGLLVFGLATSAVLRQLDSVYRKAD